MPEEAFVAYLPPRLTEEGTSRPEERGDEANAFLQGARTGVSMKSVDCPGVDGCARVFWYLWGKCEEGGGGFTSSSKEVRAADLF